MADGTLVQRSARRQIAARHERRRRTHTFTEVANFGGGKVPQLSEGLTPAPECAASVNIAPGERVVLQGLTEGDHLYQCCIHPWMRALVKVED